MKELNQDSNARRMRRAVLLSAGRLLLVLSVAGPGNVLAQNTGKLTGRVIDSATGEPLFGANVVLSGTFRGAAADAEGRFFLLGVPVGLHDIVVSFVGYQPVTVEGAEINNGYTRDLGDVALVPGLELEDVVVQYERPLLQKDAVGVPKVLSGTEIAQLPVRGVAEVMSLQPGVVAVEGRDELFVRGGRSSEVVYFVDGVKVATNRLEGISSIGVPQAAIQEQEMLIGNLSARYGDVMSGVVNITTRSGGTSLFGSLEALTSHGLDPYGTTIFSGSLGGPLGSNRVSFFVSAEANNAIDGSPRATHYMSVPQSEIDRLRESPQALPIRFADGSTSWIPLPGSMTSGALVPVNGDGHVVVGPDGSIEMSDGTILMLPDGAELESTAPTPVFAWDVVDPDVFEYRDDRTGNGRSLFNTTANITVRPTDDIRLRLGGRGEYILGDQLSQIRNLFATDTAQRDERLRWQSYLNLTHHPSPSFFYQVQVDVTQSQGWTYDSRFSRDIRDLIFYGDLDHAANAVSARFKKPADISGQPGYVTMWTDGNFGGYMGAAVGPGAISDTGYSTFNRFQTRFSASATVQVGIHQLEAGAEGDQSVDRYWAMGIGGTRSLAGWYDDSASCTVGECGAEIMVDVDGDGMPDTASSYETLPEEALTATYFNTSYYGYDVHGLRKTDDEDLMDFLDGDDRSVAPWKPRYFGAYLQDKIEFQDVILNIGLRADVFDNNARIYRDPFARVPIVRADAVADRPGPVGEDFAVYYDGDRVVGYRDLDGVFYDANGEYARPIDVVEEGAPRLGSLDTDPDLRRAAWEGVFDTYEPQVVLMPRIGVSFPMTDQAIFFARYGVVAQRPNLYVVASLTDLLDRDAGYVRNPNLRPERTIEYEIGFRQRVGQRLAVSISGFFRQIKDLITVRQVEYAYPAAYRTSQNNDFGTVKGFELDFDLRRIRNVSVSANYTLSVAEGTGSSGGVSPGGASDPIRTITPLDFDQRHRLNVSLDVRYGGSEGPMLLGRRLLEHVGLNVLVQAASGFPYTGALVESLSDLTYGDRPQGSLNSKRTPATMRVDLRLDRAVPIGRSASVSLFLWIQNLLDTHSVFQVYGTTGLPDENGYLMSPGGQSYINSQFRPETAELIYRHRLRSPGNYGIPRMIRLGARLTF